MKENGLVRKIWLRQTWTTWNAFCPHAHRHRPSVLTLNLSSMFPFLFSREKKNAESIHIKVKICDPRTVFGKGLDWKKWTGIVADLIDIRKKVKMFYIEKWNFLFCSDFFIWKVIKSDWCIIKSKNIEVDFEKIFFWGFYKSNPIHWQTRPMGLGHDE